MVMEGARESLEYSLKFSRSTFSFYIYVVRGNLFNGIH